MVAKVNEGVRVGGKVIIKWQHVGGILENVLDLDIILQFCEMLP